MVRTSYTALNEKLKQNELDATVLQKLTFFVEHMSSRSFASATAIQTVRVKSLIFNVTFGISKQHTNYFFAIK
jgi:FAD synthase